MPRASAKGVALARAAALSTRAERRSWTVIRGRAILFHRVSQLVQGQNSLVVGGEAFFEVSEFVGSKEIGEGEIVVG